MRVGIICCTPYHIFTAINLKMKYYTNDSVDIYISNHFGEAYEVFNSIKKINLFNEVFWVEDIEVNKNLKNRLKAKILNKNYKINDDYDEVNIFTFSYFTRYLCNNLNREKCKISLVEDGICTYTMERTKRVGIGRIKDILLGEKFNYNDISEIKLYKKDLCVYKFSNIKQIDVEKSNKVLLENLNYIFDINEKALSYYLESKYIFFDQSFYMDAKDIGEVSLVSKLEGFLGDANLLIKLHPRGNKNKYEKNKFKSILDKKPWEIISLNESFDNKVLITISSTAVLTPTILFNEKNKVIMLYKLIPKIDYHNREFEEFIHKCKEINNNIFIPNNYDELELILKGLEE